VRLADIHKPTVRFSETLYCAPCFRRRSLAFAAFLSITSLFSSVSTALSDGSLFKSLYLFPFFSDILFGRFLNSEFPLLLLYGSSSPFVQCKALNYGCLLKFKDVLSIAMSNNKMSLRAAFSTGNSILTPPKKIPKVSTNHLTPYGS
jgi:hypothetical protein